MSDGFLCGDRKLKRPFEHDIYQANFLGSWVPDSSVVEIGNSSRNSNSAWCVVTITLSALDGAVVNRLQLLLWESFCNHQTVLHNPMLLSSWTNNLSLILPHSDLSATRTGKMSLKQSFVLLQASLRSHKDALPSKQLKNARKEALLKQKLWNCKHKAVLCRRFFFFFFFFFFLLVPCENVCTCSQIPPKSFTKPQCCWVEQKNADIFSSWNRFTQSISKPQQEHESFTWHRF